MEKKCRNTATKTKGKCMEQTSKLNAVIIYRMVYDLMEFNFLATSIILIHINETTAIGLIQNVMNNYYGEKKPN